MILDVPQQFLNTHHVLSHRISTESSKNTINGQFLVLLVNYNVIVA